MLFTKRFSCLFPLVFIAIMMFSMVRALPMQPFMGQGDNPRNPYDLYTQFFGNNAGEMNIAQHNMGVDSPALQNKMDEFYQLINPLPTTAAASSSRPIEMYNPYTKDQVEALATEIITIRPPGAAQRKFSINSETFKLQDLGDRGNQVLQEFFEPNPPFSFQVDKAGLKDVVALFVYDGKGYFLARIDAHGLIVFSKLLKSRTLQPYGIIKPNLTPQVIRAWIIRNRFY